MYKYYAFKVQTNGVCNTNKISIQFTPVIKTVNYSEQTESQ